MPLKSAGRQKALSSARGHHGLPYDIKGPEGGGQGEAESSGQDTTQGGQVLQLTSSVLQSSLFPEDLMRSLLALLLEVHRRDTALPGPPNQEL